MCAWADLTGGCLMDVMLLLTHPLFLREPAVSATRRGKANGVDLTFALNFFRSTCRVFNSSFKTV
jgi:hypothetical protein